MSAGLTIRVTLPRHDFDVAVDLALPAHGISALFGPSGSGKTTLLRCVAGLEPQARGLIRVGDEVWQDDAARVRLPTWRRPLGYVFQEASLFAHLDVRGNLEFGLKRGAVAGGREALAAAVELLGIGALLPRRPDQLSGGERQRVAIARALATQPRLLLLDEPLAAIDQARRQEILPWLERLRDQLRVPMLYVTHAFDEVARLADHLVVLERGRVTASGALNQVLATIEAPVVAGDDAGTVVAARIDERDPKWHLARATFAGGAGGALWVRDAGHALGTPLRLRVLARDVSLQLDAPARTSVQNQLRGTVEALAPDAHPAQVMVRLRCGDALLLARVTRRAAHSLALAPGMPVWVLVKSVAVIG